MGDDYKTFNDNVRTLSDRELYAVIGRLFCLCSKKENSSRKKQGEDKGKPSVDGVEMFFRRLSSLDPNKVTPSAYLAESEQERLARSLHDTQDGVGSRELGPSSPLYHVCASSIDNGYHGVGEKVYDAVEHTRSKKTLRKNIVKRLLR